MKISTDNKHMTLAELVSLSAQRSRFLSAQALRPIAQVLPQTKRLSYDSTTLDIVRKMGAIENEEIIGQLKNSSFPFDKFWIEGPTFLKNHDQMGGDVRTARMGALVVANQKESEFKFILIKELLDWDHRVAIQGLPEPPIGPYVVDGKTAACDYFEFVKVSPSQGIDLNDEALLKTLLYYADGIKATGSQIKVPHEEAIDDLYDTAIFLSRFFVLFGSEKFRHDFGKESAKEERDLLGKNAARRRRNAPLILPTKAIQIDISQLDERILHADDPKKIRTLLGWTSVRRSKQITSKYGKVFTRRPHDRRIAAPVDRRDAAREIFARDENVTVELQNDRPVRVRKLDQSSDLSK